MTIKANIGAERISALTLALLLAACGPAQSETEAGAAAAVATQPATASGENRATVSTADTDQYVEPSAEATPDEDHPVPGQPDITRADLEAAVADYENR